jgi:hypothetical protein
MYLFCSSCALQYQHLSLADRSPSGLARVLQIPNYQISLAALKNVCVKCNAVTSPIPMFCVEPNYHFEKGCLCFDSTSSQLSPLSFLSLEQSPSFTPQSPNSNVENATLKMRSLDLNRNSTGPATPLPLSSDLLPDMSGDTLMERELCKFPSFIPFADTSDTFRFNSSSTRPSAFVHVTDRLYKPTLKRLRSRSPLGSSDPAAPKFAAKRFRGPL